MKTSHRTITGPKWLPILLCSALCWGVVPATAQDSEPTPATEEMERSFGVKGGANWSNLWVKEVNQRDPRFGFHVGLFGRFATPHSLGFQIEALYDQKGETIHKQFGPVDKEITYRFDYITVPGLIIIPLGEVLELQGGGYVAQMVLSEVHRSGDIADYTTDPKDSKFNGFDYGLVGGAAINFGLGQAGVRYEHGLNELANNDISRDVLGTSKNSTIQAYLALALGKR